jgi:hypothetical protein
VLTFSLDPEFDGSTEEAKVANTKAIAAMLSTNEQIDEIPFDDTIFNRAEYDSKVAPRLECNLHRKRFRQIGTSSARRALVGAALSKVNMNRSLIFLLVSQNRDLVADVFRNRQVTRVSQRKRRRGSSPEVAV